MRLLNSNTSFETLRKVVSEVYPAYGHFEVSYQDEEGDLIKVTTNMEFKEALAVAQRDGNFLMMNVHQVAKPASQNRASEQAENPLKPLASAFCKFFGANPEIQSAIDEICDSADPRQLVSQIEELVHIPSGEGEDLSELIKNGLNHVQKELSEVFSPQAAAPAPEPNSSPVAPSPRTSEVRSAPSPSPVVAPQPVSVPAPVQKKDHRPRHLAKCDNCDVQIVGIRYKCLECADYDLCESCEALNDNGQIHKEHCFAKLRTTKQQINSGFKRFHHHRARAHHRLNTLEQEVSELKELVAQLVKQREQSAAEKVVVKPEEAVVPEPVEEEAPREEAPREEEKDVEKEAALKILREMGIEINSAVEFLLKENDNSVDAVLSAIL